MTLDCRFWQVLFEYTPLERDSQEMALTHNNGYREGSSCARISVTEVGDGDTRQLMEYA